MGVPAAARGMHADLQRRLRLVLPLGCRCQGDGSSKATGARSPLCVPGDEGSESSRRHLERNGLDSTPQVIRGLERCFVPFLTYTAGRARTINLSRTTPQSRRRRCTFSDGKDAISIGFNMDHATASIQDLCDSLEERATGVSYRATISAAECYCGLRWMGLHLVASGGYEATGIKAASAVRGRFSTCFHASRSPLRVPLILSPSPFTDHKSGRGQTRPFRVFIP
jgi:hypothetical protein